MKINTFYLMCAFSLIFTSCSSGYWFCYVDAIGETPISKSYYAENRFPADVSPLMAKEYLRYLDIVMKELGYIKTDSANADLKIAFGYNLGEKSERAYTTSTPVYRYNPSRTTYGYANTTVSSSTGKVLGTISTTASKTTPASVTYEGQNTSTTDQTRQDIEIRIDAFDEKTKEPVFSVSITDNTTASSLQDLRKYMPMYLLDAMPFIGKNTQSRTYSKVYYNDKRLQWFE